ncbi:MAG: hypothetical protein GY913_05400 [Proteobacteria bacterium]|nr:hypothetical protein [Pseudomonadota bacterium]MCP4916338.1 hypothetical protein [Pseudomonadota bacterium]
MSDKIAERKRFEAIGQLFIAFDKLLRALRLYEGSGPLVTRLLDDIQTRLGELVDGELTLSVTPAGLVYNGKPLLNADEKVPPYLFLLFCDGMRELTFLEGLDSEQVRALAEILSADVNREEDDFITLLWQADLSGLRYFATDTLEEGDIIEDDVRSALTAGEQVRGLSNQGEGDEVRLSSDDLRVLRTEEALLWVRDARTPMTPPELLQASCAKVAKGFDLTGDHRRFVAIALRFGTDDPEQPSPLVLGHVDAALAAVDVATLVGTYDGLAGLMSRAGTPGQTLRTALLDPERLEALAPLVAEHHAELVPALTALAGDDLDALVPLLNHLRPGPAQTAVQDALTSASVDLSAFHTQRLVDTNPVIVVAAIGALARTDSHAAYVEIARALGHTLTPVRAAALKALIGHYVDEARLSLGRALRDPVRDNRLLALKVLETSGESRAAGLILGAVQEAGFAQRDPEEQRTFIDALASFADPRTLDFFSKLLKRTNITRDRHLEERQLQAIEAIARMPGADAERELTEAQARWLLAAPIREAARVSLKERPAELTSPAAKEDSE